MLPLLLFAAMPPVSIDDLMAVRNVTDVRLSPDGTRVVYAVTTPEPDEGRHTPHLYLVPTAAGGKSVRLTAGKKGDDKPRWSPDGKTIAFLSDRDGRPQVWLISPDGGEASKLTSLEATPVDLEWSPDGKTLAVIASDPDPMEKRRKEKDDAVVIDKEVWPNQLHVVEVATGKAQQWTKGRETVQSLSWSPDSAEIVIAVRKSPKYDDLFDVDIRVIDAKTGKARDLVTRPGMDATPRWSPDGKSIAFVSQGGRYGWIENLGLWLVEAKGGTPRPMMTDFDENVGGRDGTGLEWTPDGKGLCFIADRKLERLIYRVPVGGGEPALVVSASGVMDRISLSRDGKGLAYVLDTPARPSDLFSLRLDDPGKPARLTDLNTHLAKRAFGEARRFAWKGKDGLDLDGLLLLPVGYQKGKRYPLLTYAHGGPAGKHSFAFEPQLTTRAATQGGPYALHVLAGKGFAVFCPNPRGSGGYGEKFRKANVRDWGGNDLDDLLSGIDALVAKGIADDDRLGIMGWSYGGVMTGNAITKTSRFKAASAGAGVYNHTSFYGTTDIPRFMEAYFGGTPWSDPEVYARLSSLPRADRVTTPTLIQHGQSDKRVPLSQSEELYRALKRHGVTTEMVVYPRQAHGIAEPKLQADMMRRNVEWFERHLKPKGPSK
jgi:dipeptidyl aminopeptidase/acylaminoacyl peptidase